MPSEPVVSLLWEPVDPAGALSSRFGFADASAALDWFGDTLADTWAMPVQDCDQLVVSATKALAWITSNGEHCIAKCSVAERVFPRLTDTASLTTWLDAQGIPVAAPVPAIDGRLGVLVGRALIGVSLVVNGDPLDVDNPSHVVHAGQTLASLHDALASYPHTFDDKTSTEAHQLVRGDYRSYNILHKGTTVSAVLNFEEVARAARAADLAKAAVLLATRFHNWAPTTPGVCDAFIGAYRDRSPPTGSEHEELRRVVDAVLVHFRWT